MNTIKIPELPEALSFEGLVAYGVDTVKDESVHIPLEFVKQAADNANEAATQATKAKDETLAAKVLTETATEQATTAAKLANEAAESVEQAKELAQQAADNANEAAGSVEQAKTAATTAAGLANEAADKADLATEATQAATLLTQQATTLAEVATGLANEAATHAEQSAVGIDDKIEGKLDANLSVSPDVPSYFYARCAGKSVLATSAQIREMVGIDYSLLTEQVVPGEYWPSRIDGTPKQVYIRTFIGTTPVEANGMSFRIMTLSPQIIEAAYVCGDIGYMVPNSFVSSAGVNFNNNLWWDYDASAGLCILGAYSPITNPVNGQISNNLGKKPYCLTFKYTKR